MLLLKPFCHCIWLWLFEIRPNLLVIENSMLHVTSMTEPRSLQDMTGTKEDIQRPLSYCGLSKTTNEHLALSLNIPSFGQHSFSCLTEEVLPQTLISRAISWRIMAEGDPGKCFL